jgi:hypothetical protein
MNVVKFKMQTRGSTFLMGNKHQSNNPGLLSSKASTDLSLFDHSTEQNKLNLESKQQESTTINGQQECA